MSKMKKTPVTRQFLTELAQKIYDPKSKRYLRLCTGTLQNGPDPKDPTRSMHCGLGELYFAMTGRQPEEDKVTEDDVVEMAYERSPLHVDVDDERKKAADAIDALKVADAVKEHLRLSLFDLDDGDFLTEGAEMFQELLNDIPAENDDGCGLDEECSADDFRKRSRRVADKLREAAALLPK